MRPSNISGFKLGTSLDLDLELWKPIFWLPIAGPKIGNEYFQTLEDPATLDAQRFYRIRTDQYIP